MQKKCSGFTILNQKKMDNIENSNHKKLAEILKFHLTVFFSLQTEVNHHTYSLFLST